MVYPKNMSTKFLAINAARKIIVIIGCLLFLISFISPFFRFFEFTLAGGSWTYYRSFESDYYFSIIAHVGSGHYWFSDYWFSPYLDVGPGMPWVLISLFTVQVLTLVFGVAFIISDKRMLSFESIVFSIAALALMTYTGERVNEELSPYSVGQYQLGYYVVYASMAMFLLAFLLNEVTKKMQATKPAKENGNIIPSSVKN
jgi:predicted membrane protein